MGCEQCGCPTPRTRLCKQCAILERAEERARQDRNRDWPECPKCGGITSGEDVVCADCRRNDIASDGGTTRPLQTARNLVASAVETACVTSIDDRIAARLSLAFCGILTARDADSPTHRTLALEDVSVHLTAITETAEHEDVVEPAREALQLVRTAAGGETTW